jgi:DNA-binding transcriptional ArsR family regulator
MGADTLKADTLFHPVRFRVFQTLVTNGPATVGRLAERLPDIPAASLYRHVNALAGADLLRVVEERKARGAVEKVFAINDEAATLGHDELASATGDDHLRYFTAFVAGLIRDYERYLRQGTVDIGRDLVGYRQEAIYLSDDELLELVGRLSAIVGEVIDNDPATGRRRRRLTTVVMPADAIDDAGRDG